MQNKTPKNKWSPHNKTISALFAEHHSNNASFQSFVIVLALSCLSCASLSDHFSQKNQWQTHSNATQTASIWRVSGIIKDSPLYPL